MEPPDTSRLPVGMRMPPDPTSREFTSRAPTDVLPPVIGLVPKFVVPAVTAIPPAVTTNPVLAVNVPPEVMCPLVVVILPVPVSILPSPVIIFPSLVTISPPAVFMPALGSKYIGDTVDHFTGFVIGLFTW
jgi:hypothetical protein